MSKKKLHLKHLIHQLPDMVDVLVADLDYDVAGISEEFVGKE
jgi:hypothetical protein